MLLVLLLELVLLVLPLELVLLVLPLELFGPAQLALPLQPEVLLLLLPAHAVAELVLPEDAVDSRLLDLHVVPFAELQGRRVVPRCRPQLLPPVFFRLRAAL